MAAEQSPLPEGTDTIIEGAGVSPRDEAEAEAQSYGGAPDDDAAAGGREGGTGERSGGSQQAGSAQGGTRQGEARQGGSQEGGASWADGGSLFDRFTEVKAQGYDQARAFAVQGKDRATGALDDLLKMINDAADQVDSKLGGQYGDYARRAASGIADFNEALKDKDVDDLFAEARQLIARAPAVAVGTAAALGFVVARLARAGLDEQAASGADTGKKG